MVEFQIMAEPDANAVARVTKAAISAHTARARYTDKINRGKWPVGRDAPPKPTRVQKTVVKVYNQRRKATLARTTDEWFKAIDAAVEDKQLNAFAHHLIWWDLCDKLDVDTPRWREKWVGWDFDTALTTDWPLMRYRLHCCGLHPFTAMKIATPTQERTRWANHLSIEYQCPVCDTTQDGFTSAPVQCGVCGQYKRPLIRIS